MDFLSRLFPWSVVGIALLVLLLGLTARHTEPEDQMQLSELVKVPVVDGGRVKPLGSVAREALLIISSRQTYRDAKGEEQPAIKWLLDTMTANKIYQRDDALSREIFRIDNDQVRSFLKLKSKEGSRYSFEELTPQLQELQAQAERSREKGKEQRDLFDQKVLELHGHLQMFYELAELQTPLLVPPSSPSDEWKQLLLAVEDARDTGRDAPEARSLVKILGAYARDDVKAFNSEVADYRQQLATSMPDESRKASLETFFDDFQPFYVCAIFYVMIFLLACLGWIGWSGPLHRAAFWLAILTLTLHTCALIGRMYLMDRWFVFVTNLYSSAVYIGWGGMILALIVETFYPVGIGSAVGGVLGAATALLAPHLDNSVDTLELLQPVLDTNFWLATHVTCVATGYFATLVTGFVGMTFIVLRTATPKLDRELYSIFGKILYGVLCFATLFSFTGTVLGGIWADQSWGRFWGWDPKENGAVLIVMWNALILHARWAGLIKTRGLANLTVIGNMITGWSWSGTNQLGIGLHAYGFNNTLATGLLVFWIVEGAFLIAGLLPEKWCMSSLAGLAPPPRSPNRLDGRLARSAR